MRELMMVNAHQTIAIMVLKSLISIGLFNAQFIGTPTELVSMFMSGFAADLTISS